MPGVFAFHVPNGGKRGIVEAVKFKRMGVKAGVPDVIALAGGKVHALELKAPGGRLSPAQRQTMIDMESAGARTAVASSLDEALITLEVWGILKRGSVAA